MALLEKCSKCGSYCREFAPTPTVGKFICSECVKKIMREASS